jgi:hypothetical protein
MPESFLSPRSGTMTLATGFGAIFIVTNGYLHNAEKTFKLNVFKEASMRFSTQ